LHLVKPFGFSLEDRQLRRAGLDYWQEVPLQLWDSFHALQRDQPAETRYFFLTTKTKCRYYSVNFRKNDFLVFGRETKGLPHNLLAANTHNCITIPMHGTRSLNLATAVAIVLFEAVRQQQV
jgi:tRNA (cytidine/uridine-2'-O-)-methyltransferase